MALAKCGWHQNDTYCGGTGCNVFVCANAHVHSRRFHYILTGDAWMASCLLAASLLCWVFFSNSHHKTCYLPLSSRHDIDCLLRISNMKMYILQLLFHKCWVAWQSPARLNNVHVWNLRKKTEESVEEYGWTLSKVICLSTMARVAWATFYPSIRARQNTQPFLSGCERTRSTQHFCPVTSNPPEIWWHFIDGLHLTGWLRMEGQWERGRKEKRRRGRGGWQRWFLSDFGGD